MAFPVFIFILLVIFIGLWWWLSWREKRRTARGLINHPPWRTFFAAFAVLVMLFSGGCSLFFLPAASKPHTYVPWSAIAIYGGIPFLVGSLILWASMRRKKS
jgi:membrane protein DedA with SNARE-associated domain